MLTRKSNKTRSYLLYAAFLCVISVCSCSKNKAPKAGPIDVTVEKAKIKDVPFKNELVGQTVSNGKVNIKSRVTGFIEKINFKAGSIVKKGDVLYEIEKSIYDAEVKKDNAKLKDKIITLQNDKIDYDRHKDLLQKDAIATREYDEARTAYLTSQANVLGAQADLQIAKSNLGYCTIRAPFDGKIGISNYTVGSLVEPSSGTLVNLVQLNPMLVEFNPNESLYLSNAPSAKDMKNVTVKIMLSNGKMYGNEGHIDYINNEVDSATGTIQFRAAFPNPENLLLPGQYVKVILEKKSKMPSIVIPQSAVMTGQLGEYVYVVSKGNIAEVRKVVTGNSVLKDIVIIKGLKQGETVVVDGAQKLSEGQVVNPLNTAESTGVKSKATIKEPAKKQIILRLNNDWSLFHKTP